MTLQPAVHRFSVDEYYRMADAGLFAENDRVELIEGEVVEMAPIGSRHAACVSRLAELLRDRLGGGVILRVQDPVRLGEWSEPQPDLAVVARRDDWYGEAHPGPSDVVLLVEVADTTAVWDRERKVPLYASAGIPEVWLVDLAAGEVETYRGPEGNVYRDSTRHGPDDRIASSALAEPGLVVSEFLA